MRTVVYSHEALVHNLHNLCTKIEENGKYTSNKTYVCYFTAQAMNGIMFSGFRQVYFFALSVLYPKKVLVRIIKSKNRKIFTL